jgi:hypothetical protein
MINLEEVSRFVPAIPGQPLVLDHDKRRVVRLELNTAARCQLRLETAELIQFLANVEGRETVTFIADGPCAVHWDCDDEVWWFSPEMDRSAVALDATTFVKIPDRQAPARNVQFERMMLLASQNQNAMFQQLSGEIAGLRRENVSLQQEVRKRGNGVGGDGGAGANDPGASGGAPGAVGSQPPNPPGKPKPKGQEASGDESAS